MPKIWITSDKHHQHNNIISYENRPFKSVDEMDQKLISNHNEMVGEDDICYDVGDFFFKGGHQGGKKTYCDYLRQYNGRYMIIRGNHERNNSVIDKLTSATMQISNLNVLLIHDPINAKTKYDLILCGHVHSAWLATELCENNKKSLIINCGVDVWNYRPVEWKQLEALYNQWKCGKLKVPVFDKEALRQLRANRRK